MVVLLVASPEDVKLYFSHSHHQAKWRVCHFIYLIGMYRQGVGRRGVYKIRKTKRMNKPSENMNRDSCWSLTSCGVSGRCGPMLFWYPNEPPVYAGPRWTS